MGTRRKQQFIDQSEDDRERLVAAYQACCATELACTVTADGLARLRGSGPPRDLLLCAVLCGDTATALAQLEVPDVNRVVCELVALRAACAIARLECERYPDDAMAARCSAECERCETTCGRALATLAIAA